MSLPVGICSIIVARFPCASLCVSSCAWPRFLPCLHFRLFQVLQRQGKAIVRCLSSQMPFGSSARLVVLAPISSVRKRDGMFNAFLRHQILLLMIGVSTHCVVFAVLWIFTGQTFSPIRRRSSNHALQPTAGRFENTKMKLESRELKRKLAPASGGSAPSR